MDWSGAVGYQGAVDPLLREIWPSLTRLVPAGARVLVGASGGPDSQALLHLVAAARGALELSITAVGVDHGLRVEAGAELDRAAALADALGIPFRRVAARVDPTGGLQQAARAARHAALQAEARAQGADRVALAHTATDQAETVLFRLGRGTSLRGLGAMRPRRGLLVRPLLGVTRDAVRTYLIRHGLAWADDPSNGDRRFARARLRAEVLPVLRSLHEGAELRIARLAAEAREDEALLARLAAQELARCVGPLGSLRAAAVAALERPLARRVVDRWLSEHAVRPEAARIARILDGVAAGSLAVVLDGRRVRLERGGLWIEPTPSARETPLPLDGEVRLPPWGLTLRAHTGRDRSPHLPDATRGVAFDRGGLHLGLWTRSWRRGDRMRPFGLEGHIKVGDLFTNSKVPTVLRPGWPVVLHGNEIVWVVGLRRGAAAPVTAVTSEVTWLEVGEDLHKTTQLLEAPGHGAC